MPAGQGHQTFTRYASGRGENPVDLLAPMTEPRPAGRRMGGHARAIVTRRRSRWASDSVRRWHAGTRGTRTMKSQEQLPSRIPTEDAGW